jgi:ParB family transcriptional regulator, chromosome partitioning protein
MVEKRGLGRGLSALLGEVEDASSTPGGPSGLRDIPIELIHRNPNQPRWVFAEAELDELAASIQEKGVLQPILVRKAPGMEGHFELVAGERRWRAAQMASFLTLPALVRDLDDIQVLEIGVIENVQREALNPIEEATAYEQLIEVHGRTQSQIADAVGKSRAHVANAVRLLDLPDGIRNYLLAGSISAGHARALLSAPDALTLVEQVVGQGLSVRETERRVRQSQEIKDRPTTAKAGIAKNNDIEALESDLSGVLGLDVTLLDRSGAGEIRIRYKTLEQLDEVCRRLTRA